MAPLYPDKTTFENWLRFFSEHLLHATVLVTVTGLLVASVVLATYYWPRSYPKGTPRPEDRTGMARLCAHPGVDSRDWEYIVIHHSATTGGGAAAFERYHIHVRHWESLGYHFVIGNGSQTGDGEIEVSGRWLRQEIGSHAVGYNARGIGVCLVGNFDDQHPTDQQMQSLRSLLRYLSETYDIPPDNVIGHNECEGAQTACPGEHLEISALRQWLRTP